MSLKRPKRTNNVSNYRHLDQIGLPKPVVRLENKRLTIEFLANGGKIERLPSPKRPKVYSI